MLFKIIGIGLCGVIINLILREYKSDFAFFVNVVTGLLIFIVMLDGVKDVINEFGYIRDLTGMKVDVVTPIIKVIGIGYITEFSSNLAEDSGNKSLATKIVMGGKIAICVLAIPVIKSLINTIISLI